MKKSKKIIGFIIGILIICVAVTLIICLHLFGQDTSVPEIPESAIQYDFRNNNLLGLSKISIDEKIYIYEFSSIKYINKSRIRDFNNSNSEKKAVGLFQEKDSNIIVEKTISDVEIIYSRGKTYVIVRPNSENGKYLGIYLFFNDFKDRIEVLYDKDPIVAVGRYDYEKNQFKRKSQNYNSNEWERKTIIKDSINAFK